MKVNSGIAPKIPAPDTVTPERKAAEQLEAAFIAEMLKASGLGKTPETFGGGAGEDQFASFLREAQAKEIVKAGGFGLAEHFERSMTGDT